MAASKPDARQRDRRIRPRCRPRRSRASRGIFRPADRAAALLRSAAGSPPGRWRRRPVRRWCGWRARRTAAHVIGERRLDHLLDELWRRAASQHGCRDPAADQPTAGCLARRAVLVWIDLVVVVMSAPPGWAVRTPGQGAVPSGTGAVSPHSAAWDTPLAISGASRDRALGPDRAAQDLPTLRALAGATYRSVRLVRCVDRAIKAWAEESPAWPGLPRPRRPAGVTCRASCLPSSTPHWSKLSMPHTHALDERDVLVQRDQLAHDRRRQRWGHDRRRRPVAGGDPRRHDRLGVPRPGPRPPSSRSASAAVWAKKLARNSSCTSASLSTSG